MIALLTTILADIPSLSGRQRILLMLPLCLSIAIVYKATRVDRLQELPAASLVLWGTIVVGMYAVGVGFWALFCVLA